jgi:hypothetical protein
VQCGEHVVWCARVGQRGTIDDRGPVTDGLAVGATSGNVYARDKRRRPDGEQLLDVSVPAEYRPRAGEKFTLRLDRATREFFYIVRGRVSPAQFTDLADGPLEFVAFPFAAIHPRRSSTCAWTPRALRRGRHARAAPLTVADEVCGDGAGAVQRCALPCVDGGRCTQARLSAFASTERPVAATRAAIDAHAAASDRLTAAIRARDAALAGTKVAHPDATTLACM